MRRAIIILVSSLIVLILIVGCTSPQSGPSTGSKSQNPTPGYTAAKTESKTPLELILECDRPPLDPIKFQKFLPDNVQGFDRPYKNKISNASYVNYTRYANTDSFANFIGEQYKSKTLRNYRITVTFYDYGPCSDYLPLTIRNTEYEQNSTQKKINSHGYPALYMSKPESEFQQNTVSVVYGVSNRLSVSITATNYYDGVSISDEEADIEKFANAIDFKGFAASV